MEIRPPANDREFAAYYALRYTVLRQPWGEPNGSERDELEDTATHAAAFEQDELIGVARLHQTGDHQGQIRFMAVRDDYAGRGVGTRLLSFLEQAARERSLFEIILNAREKAVGFYTRMGYEITGEGPLLWDVIPHKKMRKTFDQKEAVCG